jgi:hypothetical protein
MNTSPSTSDALSPPEAEVFARMVLGDALLVVRRSDFDGAEFALRVAMHEAGHAVVLMDLGMKFDWVRAHGDSPCVWGVFFSSVERDLAMYFGGIAAEVEMFGAAMAHCSRHDFDYAIKRARKDMDKIRAGAAMAREIVARRREDVIKLGYAARDGGTLTEKQVRAVLKGR